jgi:hypothetical protein
VKWLGTWMLAETRQQVSNALPKDSRLSKTTAMSENINESVVEQVMLDWLCGLGYDVLSGLTIAPGEPAAERADYKQVFLFNRLQTKLLSGELRLPSQGFGAAGVPQLPN